MSTLWDLPGRLGGIDEMSEWPSGDEFASKYAPVDGYGRPLVLRGVASQMPAMEQWSDANLSWTKLM